MMIDGYKGYTHIEKPLTPDYLHSLDRHYWQLRHLRNEAIAS